RILLYAGYFFAGIGVGAVGLHAGLLSENGELARRWLLWLGWALLFFAAILFLIYVKRHWIDLDMPPPVFQISYGLAFAMFSATMVFAVLAILLRFAKSGWGLLDALQPSAYGIFLLHYIFIIWLQYAVYDHAWPAFAKFAIVFAGTLSMSWALTLALRRIPVVARMI
ncbi:MAG TPA: acyltransferase family protein, partial [Bradyrhizobium sp.]|nr:acyltransferase family protein [Bradyrhizobium sp.]